MNPSGFLTAAEQNEFRKAFMPFPKIGRLSRECIITEKIDGTNAQVNVCEDGTVMAGSRNRYLTRESDNFGFAAWVEEHQESLRRLGPGRHFGEWWGRGIQRGYELSERRFSLFNVHRWDREVWERRQNSLQAIHEAKCASKQQHVKDIRKEFVPLPDCCLVVPVVGWGPFCDETIADGLRLLRECGSQAAPGFWHPEGIVIYHEGNGSLFKKTFEGDEGGKGEI